MKLKPKFFLKFKFWSQGAKKLLEVGSLNYANHMQIHMFIYGLKTQKGQLKSLFSNFQACDSS
jgi:hypothetical protein